MFPQTNSGLKVMNKSVACVQLQSLLARIYVKPKNQVRNKLTVAHIYT